MNFETIHFEKICRTCLSENTDMRSVFSTDDSNGDCKSLYEMLTSCTTVQVFENDGLPHRVCLQCVNELNRAFCFKQMCEKSDNTLRELFLRPIQASFLQLKPILMGAEMSQSDVQLHVDTLTVDFANANTQEPDSSNLELVQIDGTHHIEDENVPLQVHNTYEFIDSFSAIVDQDQPLVKAEVLQLDQDVGVKLFDKIEVIDNILEYKDENYFSEYVENDTVLADNVTQIPEDDLSVANAEIKVCSFAKETEAEESLLQPSLLCEECAECFPSESDLKAHTKTHRQIQIKRHICKECQMSFSSTSTLCRHVRSHHTGTKRHHCPQCSKSFARSDDLTRHIRTHTGEKPFACQLCSKSFAQSFRLLEHVRAHKGEKSFVCPTCGKAFCRYTSFKAHTKIHSGIKTHTCGVCGKKLCGSGSLAIHMKTHTGQRDHVCPYCQRGFTTPSNLNIHIRTHTGEKPYVCDTCGKGFPDPSRLTVHSRSHTGEKPYVCLTCGRGCVSSSQLKKHLRIHTGEKPYLCKLCTKSFPRSEDLKIHIKTHSGDRSHICEVCNKGFYQASTLKVHMRIHTGEKPYECKYCSETFSQTGPLSIHLKKCQMKTSN